MKIIAEELKKFVEENPSLVTRKESKRYPGLFVLKYAKRVFYDNLWHKNPLLMECRGLVVDKDYNVVVKPFTKVFNYGENGTTFSDDTLCRVVRKVNGFMACVTKHENYSELVVSTTGSLDSDFVKLAEKWINPIKPLLQFMLMDDGETMIFEICDKTDPHIIEENPGPYLIGCYYDGEQIHESYLDHCVRLYPDYKWYRPELYRSMRFADVKELVKTVEHEGFMVYDLYGNCLKLKSPYYLVTKFLARLGDTKLQNIFNSGDLRSQMRHFDEEYYPLFKYIASIKDKFKVMNEQERIKLIKEFLSGKG